MRVAVTVEQSWHVVPGGIAVATVELLRALSARGGMDLVGVSAWHRRQPPTGLVPPVPVRRFPLPRQVLYESWQRLRTPSVERVTGRPEPATSSPAVRAYTTLPFSITPTASPGNA